MITFILAGICIAAFIAQRAIPGFTEQFVLVSAEVVGRPWTLITAIFLHGDLQHLLFNMFALVLFGMILESIVGRKKSGDFWQVLDRFFCTPQLLVRAGRFSLFWERWLFCGRKCKCG